MAYTDIDKPSDHFNTVTYTGTGAPQSITGVNFQPDWIWFKRITGGNAHGCFFDVNRGVTKLLSPSQTDGDQTITNELTSFDSDGFTLSTGGSGYTNQNSGKTYVAWNWKAGGSPSSNSDGDITSSVSVNTDIGFSIVTYTGSGSSGDTVGHGLGVAPKITIIKQRNSSNGWNFWAYANNSGDPDSFNELNGTTSWYQNQGANGPFTATPDSSVLTLTNYGQVNGSSNTYVAYCFAEKKGFSRSGFVESLGDDDGSFFYCGFKPAWVMLHADVTDTWNNWYIFDNKRNVFNITNSALYANIPNTENGYGGSNYAQIDMYSSGFKIRRDGNWGLGATGTKIFFMAFAEQPIVGGTSFIPAPAK